MITKNIFLMSPESVVQESDETMENVETRIGSDSLKIATFESLAVKATLSLES